MAQVNALEQAGDGDYLHSLKELLFNRNYVLLLLTYGINVGVFYAISTLLSQMIIEFYPDGQESAGLCGLLIVVAGMFGSVVCGVLLDKFHHFKLTTVMVYAMSLLGMLFWTFTIDMGRIWLLFIIAFFLGFFMTGYLPIGFEFAAELTYPISEGTTSGLLNASAQVFGVAMTIGMGWVQRSVSVFACNIALSGFLLIGTLLTLLISADLRRQKAHHAAESSDIPVSPSASSSPSKSSVPIIRVNDDR